MKPSGTIIKVTGQRRKNNRRMQEHEKERERKKKEIVNENKKWEMFNDLTMPKQIYNTTK